MKKVTLSILSLLCLCTINSYAWAEDCCPKVQPKQKCETPCPQTYTEDLDDCFLCTDKDMKTLFCGMNLSNSQLCNVHKIQEKYEQEISGIEEKLECENEKLSELEKCCASASDIRKQKKVIKELEKMKKKICDCYEEQFKASLSTDQKRIYNKNKK